MKRKHKKYSRPKRPFDKARIDSENILKENYGLKNKKEIWRSDAKIKSMREKAKKLISADVEEQKALFARLNKLGFEVNSIADVLGLEIEDYLKRRLQTIVVKKRLATTMKGGRQLITHKKVLIGGRVVNSPSYIVPVKSESEITVKKSKPEKKVEKEEEAPKEEKPSEKNKPEEKKE